MTDPRDTMRWVWRGSALAALLIGWLFIAWQNHFHITAPLVFVCLGYLAVVATVYNLWRTGAAVVGAEDDRDSTWAKPAGALGELEREKRTLLKAIKEAEFDHEMGKLSKRDVDEMIRAYRARAIEVIKEIDRLGLGAAGSPREQIMREVRARLELEAKSHKKAAEPRQGAKASSAEASTAETKKKSAGEAARRAEPAAVADAAATPRSAPGQDEPGDAAAAAAAVEPAVAQPAADTNHAAAQTAQTAQMAKAAQTTTDDEAMDADSTTTVEPKRDDLSKEATP